MSIDRDQLIAVINRRHVEILRTVKVEVRKSNFFIYALLRFRHDSRSKGTPRVLLPRISRYGGSDPARELSSRWVEFGNDSR